MSLFLFVLVLFYPFCGYSQENRQASPRLSIATSATIIGDIELITVSDMNLADASRMQEGDIVNINPVFDPEAGIMRARGAPQAQIRISYLSEREVTRVEGPGSLIFHYLVSGYPGDNQRESELLDPSVERELRFSEKGEYFFWIGGEVNLENALPGSYQGEFTIEIEYI